MEKKKKIVLFGTGKVAERKFCDLCEKYDVLAVYDNDTEKQGKEWNGFVIKHPQELKGDDYDFIYICSSKYYFEIRDLLITKYGCDATNILDADNKYDAELDYWKSVFKIEKEFRNEHYKRLMLGIADEKDDSFWKERVVADFGCGPRGSLFWTDSPKIKIGIDALIPQYMREFELRSHNMIYVTSNENCIPLPNDYVDFLCTINSLDHVENLDMMIKELLRILKKGGKLIASFNLNEQRTTTEPQTLTEELLNEKLFGFFNVISYKRALKNPNDTYGQFWENNLLENETTEEAILWVRAKKI